MTRDYELGFILNPEVSEEQTQAIVARVEQTVANYRGQIVKVNTWGRRRLAYPIEHHRDGFYVFIDMILTPETVTELDRTLKVSEEVLRHMIKKRDPKTVQKEREARTVAAVAPPPLITEAKEEEDFSPAEEDLAIAGILSPEDMEHVPPAIEEEEIEA